MRHALLIPLLLASCAGVSSSAAIVDTPAWSIPAMVADDAVTVEVLFPAGSVSSAGPLEGGIGGVRHPEASGWIDFVATFPECGRWRTEVMFADGLDGEVTTWVEDRVGNKDGRSYNVTGPMVASEAAPKPSRDGSPLDAGLHRMRLHHDGGAVTVTGVRFTMIRPQQLTPRSMTQSMDGDEWAVVWADEFNGEGLPDQTKWLHDVGNWGWGNFEPQYYTVGDTDNARQEGGNLIIEARPDDDGMAWTSARLTTRGRVSFLRGRIEMRAKVPAADGTWAAGWLLGDDYRDEISWPYCGEVDIMEAVGKEISDDTGNGINHGSCHTRAYYFKQGNHITNVLPVDGMSTDFHVYACEWDEDEVRMYVDGVHYYTYDKKESAEAWPFDRPQNIILNLAMGGGMGGPITPGIGPQQVVVDYVRVLEKR